MLSSLHVHNYILIDSLDISFPEGLVIITGETGAGKSIILGALSLVLGSKADASIVGAAGENCVVEAVFKSPETPSLTEIFQREDIPWEDSGIIVRRTVGKSGRSRAFINDIPVQAQVLQEMGSHLVDIHSQHQSLRLQDPRFRLGAIDSYAALLGDLQAISGIWKALQAKKARLKEVEGLLANALEEKDYLMARWERLEKAALRDGELEELEIEQKQLANAESILENLFAAHSAISSDGDGQGVPALLKEAEKRLSKVSGFIPSLGDVPSRLESARLEIEDILGEIESEKERVDVSPARLEAVEERMGELYSLMKSYRAGSVAELIGVRDSLSGRIFNTGGLEEEKRSLEMETASLQADYDSAASALHSAREKAAAPFAGAVSEALKYMELEEAVFSVHISPSLPGPSGTDSVEFLFSASGKNPADVGKVASGGELSRIMLSLKSTMAQYMEMPTLIFDEIDTGVSGSVADKMGTVICDMGNSMQVLAITHLPQVAAKGSAHFLVEKTKRGDAAPATSVRLLDMEGRVAELSRMLSGSSITPEAEANARALLASSR